MVIVIRGSRRDIRLGISETGSWWLGGRGEIKLPSALHEGESTVIDAIGFSPADWSIHPGDAAAIDIDANSVDLYKRATADPRNPHGKVQCWGSKQLAVTLVLPAPTFPKVKELLQCVIASDALEYLLEIPYVGIRVSDATTESPSALEFLQGTPSFFDEFSMFVRQATPDN